MTPQIVESERSLVLVDDEDLVLRSLETLLSLETEYQLHPFRSAEEAIAFGRSHRVDVVLSDFLMPGMDGIDCLRTFRELHPSAPRILLTGYADKDSAIRAINEVGLFQYLEKPWSNDDLLLVVRNAMERKALIDLLARQAEEIEVRSTELRGLRQEILRTLV